jgi:hypothetical protein
MNDSIKVHINHTAQEIKKKFCELKSSLSMFFQGEWKAEPANTSLILHNKIRLYLITDEKDRPETVRILYQAIGPLLPDEISEIMTRARIEFIVALHS